MTLVERLSGLPKMEEPIMVWLLSKKYKSKSLVTVVPLLKVVDEGNERLAASPSLAFRLTRRKSLSSP